jgi:glycosyltransferase involved in cell wall biosynthesis
MARASIYALPARYEPFGLSALEAALSGCALVLGDIPSLREVWGEAATYVDPDDADALTAAIARLASDDTLRDERARLARERGTRFGAAAMTERYLDLYRALAARGRARRARREGSARPGGEGQERTVRPCE